MNIGGSNKKPDIYFHSNGQIDITARITKLLEINEGDSINVWSSGNEYYLYVANRNPIGNEKGVCRKTNKGSNFLRANFIELARNIISVCGKKEAYLPIGELVFVNPIGKAVTLITRNNLYEERH